MAQDTNFTLTEDQEKDLLEYVEKRLGELETDNQERIDSDKLSWDTYHNIRSDRQMPDTIFEKSNLSVPLTSLVVDHFVSRAEDDITGTAPFFKFDAQGRMDALPAEDYDRYFNWKMETVGHMREVYEEAYLQMFVQRACIMKATYKNDFTVYLDKEALVLYPIGSDEPVVHPELGLIIQGETDLTQVVDPATQMPITVLSEDPSFIIDPRAVEFRPSPDGLEMEAVHYRGPKAVCVDYDRFLAPSSCLTLGEADFLAEKYDKPLSWAENIFLERDFYGFDQFVNAVQAYSADAKTEGFREDDNFENLGFDKDNVVLPIVECWIKRDVLGKGYPQEFVVFYEPQTKKAVYYEYVAKISPDKRVPYTSVSIGKDRSRWWGPSLPERILSFQNFVDKQFNSQAYRNELAANPLVGVNPQALEEEPDDVEMYAGKVYTLKDGYSMREFASAIELPNLDARTQDLIDFVVGFIQLWLGVSNMAQGDYQALAPANTATGVEATLREASKIGRRWMRRVVKGIEENLEKLVAINVATLDQKEVFEYMEGEVRSFAELDPRHLENLNINVSVELSQNQGQRAIERADLALKTMDRYFAYPPELRPFVKPMMKHIVRALGYENADDYLPEEAPDVPRDEAGAPVDGNSQASAAVRGMGNSNQTGANQYQEGTG